MSVVLVLNADCGPLHRVSVRHAVRMLFRQVAVVHEARPDARIGVYPIPTVVRLVSYVVTRWRRSRGPAPISARRALRRPRSAGRLPPRATSPRLRSRRAQPYHPSLIFNRLSGPDRAP